MRIYDDNSMSIGNTPLVKINRIAQGTGVEMLAKTTSCCRRMPRRSMRAVPTGRA